MATLYTLDRSRAFSTGMQINLQPPNYARLGTIPFDQSFLPARFPQGLSKHGQRYLINWPVLTNAVFAVDDGTFESATYYVTTLEIVFELVRRLEFPNQLSRFQSMFACRTEADLRRFATQTGSQGTIYEIETDRFQVHDMALLRLGNAISHAWRNASNYWCGTASDTPLWECLIELPVNIGRRVGTI